MMFSSAGVAGRVLRGARIGRGRCSRVNATPSRTFSTADVEEGAFGYSLAFTEEQNALKEVARKFTAEEVFPPPIRPASR